MTLVLKTLTQQAPEGAEELRYHALADEVVKETWDYANSQGKFAGVKKMPYVDTY